jgi:hypothetical protein
MEGYELAMSAEIRRRMAERGKPTDDLTDTQLHRALRIALVTLAHDYAPEGERISRPSASARRLPAARAGRRLCEVVARPRRDWFTCSSLRRKDHGPSRARGD